MFTKAQENDLARFADLSDTLFNHGVITTDSFTGFLIRNLKSAISNPQSQIRNLKSAISNPQSQIRNLKSAIRNQVIDYTFKISLP
jgi:hypothetical protein